MSDLAVFVALGLRHITDFAAMDHILFLCALAAIYRLQDWRRSLWVITAFTVGHSMTLAVAVTGALALPTRLIEFLIPVTIVATCVENVMVRDRARAPWGGRYARCSPECSGSCTGPDSRITCAGLRQQVPLKHLATRARSPTPRYFLPPTSPRSSSGPSWLRTAA